VNGTRRVAGIQEKKTKNRNSPFLAENVGLCFEPESSYCCVCEKVVQVEKKVRGGKGKGQFPNVVERKMKRGCLAKGAYRRNYPRGILP
jgi:hypothetical protein